MMVEKKMATRLPKIIDPNKLFESCLISKQAKLSFPAQTSFCVERPLQQVHADLCGSITPSLIVGNKCCLLLVDDYSCWMWVSMLREKGETVIYSLRIDSPSFDSIMSSAYPT